MNIADHIRIIPDFPKPGILFRDITSLLLDPVVFEETCDQMIEKIKPWNPTVIAAAEARGFIFGSVIALKMRLPFVLLRKPGKLPGKTVSYQYELEYGTNELYGISTYVSTDLTTQHRVQLGSLAANTTYHFRIVASRHNLESSRYLSKDYTFTTPNF